jgi:hypothetical protein
LSEFIQFPDVAALFCGGQEKPSAENIKRLSPEAVLVSKNRVQTILYFFMTKNLWYNLADLCSQDDEHDEQAFTEVAALCWLSAQKSNQVEGRNADHTDRNEYIRPDKNSDVALEAVGSTAGDRSPQNYCIMKASALAWFLSRKQFIKMQGGSKLLFNTDPAILTYLFPHLDPWGIMGFDQSQPTQNQHISFEHQVKNLLMQYQLRFQVDPNFTYVCWNIV